MEGCAGTHRHRTFGGGGRCWVARLGRIDYDRAAVTYDQGRAHPLPVFAEWRQRLGEYLPLAARGPVLDVGAGTGIWANAIAEWFEIPVVAVEPSVQMRSRASAKPLPPGVAIVAGDGEAIPLRDASCRAAWLSTVIHYLPDLGAGATELARVLTVDAPVLIRSSFPGRHDEIPLFRYFPGAGRVANTFPTVDEAVAACAAGFSLVVLRHDADAVGDREHHHEQRLVVGRHAGIGQRRYVDRAQLAGRHRPQAGRVR
ncbi:MAG: class I SAM-dependent methyltransferase [Acidimicrobiales bacterium]